MKLIKGYCAPLALWVALAAPALSDAQSSAAPAGSTGQCKDGTYSTAASKKGACSKHGGVQEWYPAATTAAPASPAAPAAAAAAPAAAATAPAAASAAAPAASSAMSKTPAAMRTAAAGGGPGQVWLNTKSNVYHCPGTTWYGKTKEGSYMSESDAKAKGGHADHGKACT